MAANTRKIKIVGVQLIVLIIENIIWNQNNIFNADVHIWFAITSIMIIINISIQIISLKLENKLLTFGGIFIILSYLIHCSYVILLGLDVVPSNSAIYIVHLNRHGISSFISASKFAINSISMFFIGYIAASNKSKNVNNKTIQLDKKTAKFMKSYGITSALLFGIIYYLSTFFAVFSVFNVGSYSLLAELKNLSLYDISLNLQPFFFSSLFLLAVYYKFIGRRSIVNFLIVIFVISILFSFLSGSRIRGTLILIVIFILWFNYVETLSWKKIIVICFAALFFLQTFIAIRMTRQSGFSINNIFNAYFNIENNIFYETLQEFGVSIFVTAGFMGNGLTGEWWEFVVKELGSILPKVSKWGGIIFKVPMDRTGFENIYHLGTTYIADFYFYFGFWGQYVMALYGMWLAFIDNKIEKWQSKFNYIAICIAIPGINSVLSSVRSPALLGIKLFLYSYLIYIFFSAFLTKGKIK